MPNEQDERKVATVDAVLTEQEEEERKKKHEEEKDKEAKAKKDKKQLKEEEDLSEEDKQKKEELEMLVERVQDADPGIGKMALDALGEELRTATSSMTSVPKPLKFLRPHFDTIKTYFESIDDTHPNKAALADVLSVLATTIVNDQRLALKYRLAGSEDQMTKWGSEYIRNLTGEIAAEFQERQEQGTDTQELMSMVFIIVPFLMKHSAPIEAVDLLSEVDALEKIKEYVDDATYHRVCLYLISMAQLLPEPEPAQILATTYDIYTEHGQFPDALRIALKLNDEDRVTKVFSTCQERVMKKQLALMLACQRVFCDIFDEDKILADDELRSLASGEQLNSHFMLLAKELDVMEPKLPEDVYKSHLEEKRTSAVLDSAKQNLASTLVNAFVNVGFCKDKLMTVENSGWLYKNKDHGMTAAVASIGMLYMWNIDEGLSAVDKYTYSSDPHVKAGAWMAIGLTNAGVRHEVDPALGLIQEHLLSNVALERLGAAVGLGYAYAGTRREDLREALSPVLLDGSFGVEPCAMAALSLGLVFLGSEDGDLVESLVQALMDQANADKACNGPAIFTAVALGLLFLGKGETHMVETTLEMLKAIDKPLGKYASFTLESCAHAGSGNVLQIQKMLHQCAERTEEDKEEEALVQSLTVLAVPLIALGEDVGLEMTARSLDHILQYGDIPLRRAVPIAMALQNASNPRPNVVDTLSKLSHDADADVALHAIIALGLVGAGTNNSRIAGLLRQLAAFYAKDANALFIVRIAQGLLYMGKGLVTINPLHSDRLLYSPVNLGAFLVVLHACLSLKNTILGRFPYLLYHLGPAIVPRMVLTVDEDLNHLQVPVRVGQAVDVVGQAGRPKSITGFQTHQSPVVLSYNDRAELATEEYVSKTTVLEHVVVLTKNPDYKPTVT